MRRRQKMISSNKLKKIKWFTIIGALANLAFCIILFVYMTKGVLAIEHEYAGNEQIANSVLMVYRTYQILLSILSIDMVFSLLLISSSFRIDQISYRLKWVNIVVGLLSTITLVILLIITNKYKVYPSIKVNIFTYILLGLSLVLIAIDPIMLYIKYKNNPFYHNGKFKKTYNNSHQHASKTEDGYINPRPREEDKVVDEKDVIDANLSYYEIYEKRSKELLEVEDQFDQGLINEEEYNKKRKAIYDKYDRYN